MNDLIIAVVLAAVIFLSARYVYREKKKGRKCIGCPAGGSCCGGEGGCCTCPGRKEQK